jgi:type I restriction enzyme R subunit
MTKTNTKEIGFEEFIEGQLQKAHGFRVRVASSYDKELCMDRELVLEFVKISQPKSWQKLTQQYGSAVDAEFLKRLDSEIERRGVLSIFREGITDRGVTFKLVYWKPQNKLNPDSWKDYEKNIFSAMRQVKYSTKNENSIDTVIFLNGLPIFTIELKNQLTGQTVKDAIQQYKVDRDPREKPLAFKRILTHFAVDTEQVFMTTELRGLATIFLPFNKGDKNSSGNPTVEGKYKTHYLWEEIWSKDSILDLLSNFINLQIDEIEDERGKTKREEKLIFPRYHQLDTVRRILIDAREHGVGKNYLIQHSAGSGKSNTIAWTAHRLSELHDQNNEKIFDTIVVVTDRRILDRQLSQIVESFSQVRGVVKHVENGGKELQELLEQGIKIITTTLFKFPVIADTIERVQGKKFAVIIDEAHSSQTGEAAADLRQVLTLDEAEEQALKEEKLFKTTEDMIIERMKARKVKTPNISFFAFTATPKQKTLELFGFRDIMTGKFYPFSLYSMKQAIEEGFILDVLKNYTTYQTFFELLKKIEDDPEFNKKKAQRLLLGYVEKHEHAIGKKTQIMVEHFEEKIAGNIEGLAKAMIVTKSRLHAVKFKLAFDRYLKEKNYPHRALVAFSGTVKDGGIAYTESQMNGGIPEKQTAQEFKRDDCKFLIAAEKFQTGFDQPLLQVMYVDKKLGGVNAVQTLSRLNRKRAGKTDAFVLDFVNETDDIKEAFQPYYTTTILSEATDPNILHDLERDISQFKLFTRYEVDGFIDMYFNNKSPDTLNAVLDEVVVRYKDMLPEEQGDFKSKSGDYIRKYGFISQIVTFSDLNLEKLYIFLKLLIRKLPAVKEQLPYEILEAVDMDSYKIQKQKDVQILLENEEGVIEPMGSGGDAGVIEEEIDPLSKIIKDINERFGTAFDANDKVILNSLSQKLLNNQSLEGSIKNNSENVAKIKFNDLFQEELITMLNSHFDLYKKLDENPELKCYVNDRIFDMVVQKTRAGSQAVL